MWQPYSKLLELLGRAGVSFASQETKFTVGRIDGIDFENGLDWKRYVDSRMLWETWGPVRGSAWEPFHCVTLFAAIDELRRDVGHVSIGPVAAPSLPEFLAAPASMPAWAAPGHLVIVDLPGPQSAAVGFQLARMAGYQPVCTFDNWPHQLGVLRTEFVVAALLHYASALHKARERLTAESPPVWICDRERFTGTQPSPGRFDNRYIIEDRLLPGPRLLRAQGIRKVIYVTPSPCALSEDLRNYLDELTPKGIAVATASIATPELWMNEITYVRKFNAPSGWSLTTLMLMRSSAGGFGGFVPEPSSGGGGG
jgi:hypothetical protein